MINTDLISKLLCFLLLCTCASSKDLLVSLSAPDAYTSLEQAVQALLSGQNLAEASNTITVDSSLLSTPQTFPYAQIQGTIFGEGSINIIYSGLTQSIAQITDCSNLPTLSVTLNNPILLTMMTSFSITGFNIFYTGSGIFSMISNVGTVTFSNLCFTNTEPTPLPSSSGNSFMVNGVTQFSMTNVIYFFDGYKQVSIAQTSQITLQNITLVISSTTIDSGNSALSISNDVFYNTNSNISNIEIVCQGTPYMPSFVLTSQTNNTWISSVSVANCTFLEAGTNSLGLFRSKCSLNLEFEGAVVQNIAYNSTPSNKFLQITGTSITVLKNFQISSLNINSLLSTFVQVSNSSTCTSREPLYLSVSNLSLINSSLAESAFLVSVQGGIAGSIREVNIREIELLSNTIKDNSAIFLFERKETNAVSTSIELLHFKFADLNVTNNQIVNAQLMYFLQSSSITFKCIEANRLVISRMTFVNNSVSEAGRVIEVIETFTSITNLYAEDNLIDRSNFFLVPSFSSASLFLSNSTIKNLTLLKNSYFISTNETISSQKVLEICYYNEDTGEVFAQVRPFILYNSSFSAVNLKEGSSLLLNNNPNIIIQGNNFTQITTDSSKFMSFGYPRYLYSSSILLVDFSKGILTLTPGKMSLFTAAEDSLFGDNAFLDQLYKETRAYLSIQDPLNSVFFVSIVGNAFDTIEASNSSEAAVILQNFQIPNSSLNISTNNFSNVKAEGNYRLISAGQLAKTYFTNHRLANVNFEGYFLSYSAANLNEFVIDSSIISESESQQLGLCNIQADKCSQIVIQNNQARNLETTQNFINIVCGLMTQNITLKNNTFESVTVVNAPEQIYAPQLIAIANADGSMGTYFFILQDNYLYNISLLNSQDIDIERFQNTLILVSSAQSGLELSNNTFDLISVSPRGTLFEAYTSSINLSNSTFKRQTYRSADGAFNFACDTLTIMLCSFEENRGLEPDSFGLFVLSSRNSMSDTISVTVSNSTFRDNIAPYGTILYTKSLSVQLTISMVAIIDNHITVSGGLFYFDELSSSVISLEDTNITQSNSDEDLVYADYAVFYFDESDANFELSSCSITVAGQVAGKVIFIRGTSKTVHIVGDQLNYTALQKTDASTSSDASVLVPQFGLFEGDNFKAVFQNLQVNQVYLGNRAIFTLNCNPNALTTNYACNLELTGSSFKDLNLRSSVIIISSESSSLSENLSMLSVLLQETEFSGIAWFSDAVSTGIVNPSIPSVGRKQGEKDFAITIKNCVFSNLKGHGGLIYDGVESIYDLVLCLDNNTITSITFDGPGALISASSTQLVSFTSTLNSNSLRNTSFLLISNKFSDISSAETLAATDGDNIRIFHWSSQSRGISISLQHNIFESVNCSGGNGAIISIGFSYELSKVTVNGELSPEYLVLIASTNNSYQYIYAQNGAITYSQGDPQLLRLTLHNESLKHINSARNGGVFDIEFSTSSAADDSASRRRLLNNIPATESPPGRRLTQSATSMETITVTDGVFQNISASNGGFIYENSPSSFMQITVMNNNFSSLSASTRGGVFCLNQPNLVVDENRFSYISAGLAGTIAFSVSDQVNLSNLTTGNTIEPPSNDSLVSHGPTNLRITLISIDESNAVVLPQNSETIPSYPMFSNLTSYSLSEYIISLSLVYQRDPNDFNDYEIVPDESKECLVSMKFSFQDPTKNQKHESSNCNNSTCNILASSIVLKGKADDLIDVSVTYTSDSYYQTQSFLIRLRSCVPGEINNTFGEICQFCKSGSYSLSLEDSKCQECPTGAICNGGQNISLKPAYYRSLADISALHIIACNDSGSQCLGGDNQTNCSEVYTGVVCAQCNSQNGYFSSGKAGSCAQCYDKPKLITFTILLLIASIGYQIIMVVVTYKENKNTHRKYLIEKAQKAERESWKRTELIGTSFITENISSSGLRQQLEPQQETPTESPKKTNQKESKAGTFIVIFTLFSQVSLVLSNFDIGTASTLISVSVSVGNSNAQAVFSLQCLYLLNNLDTFKALQFETLVYVLLPIAKLLLAVLVILLRIPFIKILKTCRRRKQKKARNQGQENNVQEGEKEGERVKGEEKQKNFNENRNIIITSISTSTTPALKASKTPSRNRSLTKIGAVAVVLFLIEQPGIIAKLCQYLTCTKLDYYASQYYIKSANTIECYTDQYNSFLYSVVIPALIFWAFLIPLAIFLVLYKKRNRLFESEPLRIILGNFYNSYSKEAYYWGVVVMVFKMSFFILDSVLVSSDLLKGIVFMMIIHLYYFLCQRKPPYDDTSLNRSEKYCNLTYMVVLTMVFVRMNTEAFWLSKFCDVIIMMSIVATGGYMLINVFWLYIMKVWELVKKFKDRKKKPEESQVELKTPEKIEEEKDHSQDAHEEEQEKDQNQDAIEASNLSQIELQVSRRNVISPDQTFQ